MKEPYAHRVGYECLGQGRGEAMLGSPTRAVRGHQQIGCDGGEGGNGRLDDGLERRSGEMEAAEQRIQVLDTREPQRMSGDVHRTGMPTSGHHDKPPASDMHHQRLLVGNQRIRFPPPVAPGFMVGKTPLEFRGAVNLAGDQNRTIEEQRRLPPFDYLEALGLQC